MLFSFHCYANSHDIESLLDKYPSRSRKNIEIVFLGIKLNRQSVQEALSLFPSNVKCYRFRLNLIILSLDESARECFVYFVLGTMAESTQWEALR
jgi:hypothetical protein